MPKNLVDLNLYFSQSVVICANYPLTSVRGLSSIDGGGDGGDYCFLRYVISDDTSRRSSYYFDATAAAAANCCSDCSISTDDFDVE